jgi:hypothetical protein
MFCIKKKSAIFFVLKNKKLYEKKTKCYMSSKTNPKILVSDYFLAGSKPGMENQSRIQGWW